MCACDWADTSAQIKKGVQTNKRRRCEKLVSRTFVRDGARRGVDRRGQKRPEVADTRERREGRGCEMSSKERTGTLRESRWWEARDWRWVAFSFDQQLRAAWPVHLAGHRERMDGLKTRTAHWNCLDLASSPGWPAQCGLVAHSVQPHSLFFSHTPTQLRTIATRNTPVFSYNSLCGNQACSHTALRTHILSSNETSN